MGIRCANHVTPLYPQKLALTSPTGGGRSVGIVRSRTKATEFSLLLFTGDLDSSLTYLTLLTSIREYASTAWNSNSVYWRNTAGMHPTKFVALCRNSFFPQDRVKLRDFLKHLELHTPDDRSRHLHALFLGMFAQLQKAASERFRPSACNISVPIGQIFMKFDIWIFIENLLRKFKFN